MIMPYLKNTTIQYNGNRETTDTTVEQAYAAAEINDLETLSLIRKIRYTCMVSQLKLQSGGKQVIIFNQDLVEVLDTIPVCLN